VPVSVRRLIESIVYTIERQWVDCDSPIELAVVCTRVNRVESWIQPARRRAKLRLRVNPWKRAQTPVGSPKRRHHRNDGERNRKRTARKDASSMRFHPEAHLRKRNRTEKHRRTVPSLTGAVAWASVRE
jgi:hypothetical protein